MKTSHVERAGGNNDRDNGSVMVLVLVLMVIGSLTILPILTYASTVMRANTVVSEKSRRTEAVKAGFRMAMAEPSELYETCGLAGLNNGVTLPSPGLDVGTVTKCYLLDNARAREDTELPFGMATTYVGSTVPTGAGVQGTFYAGPADPADPSSWLDDSETVPTSLTVWMPNLPVHGLNLRTALRDLPAEYVINGYSSCKVLFPGTYKQPVVIDQPTYMTSGIYYFEDTVTVQAGADLVAGQGTILGCADDQLSAFYATDAPATHNINGLGVTMVFGDEGRLVIDDSAGPVKFRMNQRYVAADDDGVASSARVSIMTVNGDLDEALVDSDFDNSGIGLYVEDKITVPLSFVGTDTTRPAPFDDYRPSVHTPKPRVPDPPTNLAATTYNGAVTLSWSAPVLDGGSPITGYRVKSTPDNQTCMTTELLSCTVQGLTNDTYYEFDVVAINDVGDSDVSDSLSAVRPRSSRPTIVVPAAPVNVKIAQKPVVPIPNTSRYRNAFDVSWTAPNANGSPIFQYDVDVTDGTNHWTCQTTTELTCAVEGLPVPPLLPLLPPPYTVTVTATNVIGASAGAVTSNQVLDRLGESYVAPPPPEPPLSVHVPDPVVDITTTTSNAVEVYVPGYISVPQGLVRVNVADPAAAKVQLDGGVLAAWVDIVDPRPDEFRFGLLNPTTQRKIRIVTELVSGSNARSDAVVQVNETGGWAVNSWEVQTE